MLTLQEQKDLREKVSKNEIPVNLAKEMCWKDLKAESRSWHTKDWKERRENFLKDKCEVCNSREILTIQHRSHPRKYNDYHNEITKRYLNESVDPNYLNPQNEFLDHILKNYNYSPIPLCPECQSRKPNKRVTKEPTFLCTKCHFEFNEVKFKSVEELVSIFYQNQDTIETRDKCFITKDKWKNQHNLKTINYWLNRNALQADKAEKIEKEAFLLYLDETIKYLSFEDTITACKKCASNYDLNNLELCPSCRQFYKGIQFPTCIQCLPEDKRKNALAKVEFGKQMFEINKNLGID